MTTTSHPTFDQLLAFAHRLADRSAAVILPHFRKAMVVVDKSSSIERGGLAGAAFDPVTAADRAAERIIRDELRKAFPDHGIVGEEFDNEVSGSRYQWLIDPIDGTRSFIMGMPVWGTLIALTDNGKPVLGLMDQPFTGERFWSAAGRTYCRHRHEAPHMLTTRSCPALDQAILSTTHPDLFAAGFEAERFQALKTQARMTRYGGDCYAYCMLAMGGIDLIVEAGLKPYDIAALVPIIERAGGRVTGWDGQPAIGSARIVAAGDPRLHAQVLNSLAG